MGRRKKGDPISGWLIIDKPAGVSSSSVVNKLRWRYNAQKAGHGGTLDPDATGVLPIAFGEATKLIPYMEDELKTYEFWVNWGSETSTDDASGEVIKRSNVMHPERQEIIDKLPNFLGQIEQVPPQVSAVKLDGERAYKLVREGAEIELKSRPLWVEELSLIDDKKSCAKFRLVCGKGGYVRSIARDLGRELGCLGHVESLRRLSTLGFNESDAIGFQDAVENPPALRRLESVEALEFVSVNDLQYKQLRVGAQIDISEDDGVALAMFEGEPIAMIETQNGVARVLRGLNITKD